MLTRREVEGQLRDLMWRGPLLQQARSTHRRYARITLAVLLGSGMIGALGASQVRSAPDLLPGLHRSATWGAEHVGGTRARPQTSLFPTIKRRGWGTYNARVREERARRHGHRTYP